MAIGTKNMDYKSKQSWKKNLLFCWDIETRLKDKFKWLGQTLSSCVLAQSVAATVVVEAREGKI